ncbi:cysteine-rich CWC family protein [Burkholderia thailandensis USAMRU Malaysia |uniref:cysteine-rich CWC family protein n=1 Tax=Burkholderia thailandensis TaxID=57975 RepID=UPI0003ECA9BA|nr:cysteine-rich CWC family protein [Burkholderia thailandensis]AHI77591.1 cysteine-rich CWC family protein [Burkholderia thailandensis E444]AIC87595.1 cysteine-rich CWC family protein [Burkholderia thailandensis USAMRU Malaysia \
MTEPAATSGLISKRCPRCGSAFDCGARTRPFTCWCAAMPAMPPGAQPATGARCLCPECLADEIARRIAAGAVGAGAGADRPERED